MRIRKNILGGLLFCSGVLGVLCAPMAAYAHGDEASFEAPAGNYIADIGYDPTVFTAGYYTRFDFNLKTAKGVDGRAVPFDEVWVRIKDQDNTYLAAGIRKESVGPTTLLYYFASPGKYSLEASFRNANGDEVAAVSFPIVVSPSATSSQLNGYILDGVLVFFGIVLGAWGAWLVVRRSKSATV